MSGNPLKSIVIASDPPLAEKQSRSAMHTVPGLLRHPSDFVERHPHNDYRVGRFIALTVLVLAVLLPSLVRADDLQIPTISRRVTDLSGTLSADETKQLEANLQEFESATSNQIAVLMIPSLNGESLEDFSISVTDKNKFGKKGRDNGVLLIIAKVDKKMRIEVGYGLEGTLTDALSSSIIRNEIAPRFRDGDYFGGSLQESNRSNRQRKASTRATIRIRAQGGGEMRRLGLFSLLSSRFSSAACFGDRCTSAGAERT